MKMRTRSKKFDAFQRGQVRVLVTKPQIAAFGLNWQHCADMTVFPSHSYEQYYQLVRRCWRFGQTRAVMVDVISTEGEADVLSNLQRKSEAATEMFAQMVSAMHEAMSPTPRRAVIAPVTLPSWMASGVEL